MIATQIYYLGQAEAALDFYSAVFNTKPEVMVKFGDNPLPGFEMDEETKKMVMHSEMTIYGSKILMSDMPKFIADKYKHGLNVQQCIYVEDVRKATQEFQKLSEGGFVAMALGETFFAKLYGQVIDKFGNGWIFIKHA